MNPARLGRYELLRVLGVGGQGQVYEALFHGPAGVRKRVAVKVVRDPTGLKREARLGGLLRHRHLVDVFEIGEDGGVWFLAMEFCPDGTLAQRGRLPPRAVVEVGLQVCAALAYAHDELGLVHLDLKPQNLLLDGTVVKVADLGISRSRESDTNRRIEGTPGYMAPEMRMGGAVDARADIYALGVVLCELWTGERAAGESMTLSLDDLGADTPASAVPAEVPPAFQRCLEQNPDDRFASMTELAAALRAMRVEGPSLAAFLGLGEARPVGPRARTNIVREPGLIGREEALDRLARLFEAPGLVTLKGPAGIGKTRLASEAALRYHELTGEQAWICDLGEARSRLDLLAAVARALDVPIAQADERAVQTQLANAIAGRGAALLILDGFEHLAEHAEVAYRLRAAAPTARFVVTTRHALRWVGEQLLDVDALPPAEAIGLLRAAALQRGVDLGDDPNLGELAQRLDGVPLALELAAGRLGVLTTQDVLDRLSVSLLRSASGGPERLSSLQAAIAWSWDLLDTRARSGLARLAVFRGGAGLEAAAEVLQLQAGVSDVLEHLVDVSLARFSADRQRFEVTGVVQEFAASKVTTEDRMEVEKRHGAFFAGFGTVEALDALSGPRGATLLARVAADLDNLSIACRRAVARGDGQTAEATALAAAEHLWMCGPLQTGIDLLDGVRRLSEAPSGRLLTRAGLLAQTAGHKKEARTLYEAALASYRRRRDRAGEGAVLGNLGNVELELGHGDAALALYEAALLIHREVGNRGGEATVVGNLGSLHRIRGQLDVARGLYEAAANLHREAGNRRFEGITLGNIGVVLRDLGHSDRACEVFEAALAIDREVGNRQSEGFVLANLGVARLDQGRADEARIFDEAAVAIHRETGNRRAEAVALGNLGNALQALGRIDEARQLYATAVAMHREVGHRVGVASVLGSLGGLDLETGDLDGASLALAEAEALLRELHHPTELAKVLCSSACLRAARGESSAAAAALAEATTLAAGSGAGPDSEVGQALAIARRRLAAP